MTEYTFTLNAKQEAALTKVVDRVNVKRAVMDPPKVALSNTQYLLKRVKDVVGSYLRELDAEDEVSVRDAYKSADGATKSSIKAMLGV